MFLCKRLCVLQTYFHRFYNQLLNETHYIFTIFFGGGGDLKRNQNAGLLKIVASISVIECRVIGIQQAAENAVKQRRDHSRFDFSGLFSLTRQFSSILTMACHLHVFQHSMGHQVNMLSLKSNQISCFYSAQYFISTQNGHICKVSETN